MFDIQKLHDLNSIELAMACPSPSEVVGPYRKTFREALQELQELRALQRRHGDLRVRDEMLRRDVEAMTAFFVQSIRWRVENGVGNQVWLLLLASWIIVITIIIIIIVMMMIIIFIIIIGIHHS